MHALPFIFVYILVTKRNGQVTKLHIFFILKAYNKNCKARKSI